MKSLFVKYRMFVISITVAVIMILSYDAHKPIYSYIESKILDITAPVMRLGSSILSFIDYLSSKIDQHFNIVEENQKLKEKNELLERYFYLAKKIESENQQLKSELNFSTNLTYKYITAQIIGRSNDAANQQIIIDSGSQQGIKKWQLALAHNQLIGRVVFVTKNTAKILLATDQTSRIPVVSLDSRTKFLISGSAMNYFNCKYLNLIPELKEGELITTNGDDSLIPPGIMIGSVFKEHDVFYVKPNIDFNKIEFVQILQTEENAE